MLGERCVECGESDVREVTVDLRIEHNGHFRTIPDRRMHCCSCGTVSYRGDQIAEHELARAGAIREIDGLLSAEELRQIRTRYRLRQTDLEKMLSIGPKTWTRWERGKVPQSKAADTLIRLLATDPYVARRLMSNAKIENTEASEYFNQLDETVRAEGRALVRHALRSSEAQDIDEIANQAADSALDAVLMIRAKGDAFA